MLTIDRVHQMREEAHLMNNWRHEASIDEDYGDGYQYDSETAQKMRESGMPLTVVPISRDMITTVIGLHERSMRDWIVRPEHDDRYDELARVLSLKMKEAERRTEADGQCLEGVKNQHTTGIGWVEVGYKESLLDYRFRVESVPWREIWWDPRSRAANIIDDAQYIRRLRFHPRKDLLASFPKFKDKIGFAGSDSQVTWYEPEMMVRDHGWRDQTHASLDLMGLGGDLVPVEEIYYRVREKGYAIRIKGGSFVRFDEKNPQQMAMYEQGLVQPISTIVVKMRRAIVVGDHILIDDYSPYPHDDYPFVPFVYEREGRTGAPYGLLRVIRSLQDEINTRRARMMWGLNYRRVVYDGDAIDDPEILREEINRPDAMIELNPERNPDGKFEISTDYQLNSQQYQAYMDAVNMLPQVAGVPRSISGQRETGVTSGVAIQSLVDQGVNAQGRAARHASEGRRRVGNILMKLVLGEIGQDAIELSARQNDGKKLTVAVNQTVRDESGFIYIENSLQQAEMQVVLDDTPSSPTFRRQQFQEITQTLSKLGNNEAAATIQTLMMPFLVESTDLPGKREAAEMLRKKLGTYEPRTEQEYEEMVQKQLEDEKAKGIDFEERMTKIFGDKMKAELTREKVESEKVRRQEVSNRADRILAEIADIQQDIEHQEEAFDPAEITQTSRYHW